MDSKLYTLSSGKHLLKVIGGAAPGIQAPIHLIAVIDTSASMLQEDRLENVKRSLHFMFPMLSAADQVSLVTFDDYAHVHVKAQTMTADGLARVQQVLGNIKVGGATNLSAGFTAAEECIGPGYKVGLIVLTDGYINRGVKEVPALINMVRRLREANPTLTVYTVGYGAEHNAELLSAAATEGTGAYSIVNNQEHVASVFGDMLGGLMTCVAQNVEVMLNEGAEPRTRFRVNGNRVHIGDIYAATEQTLLIKDLTTLKVGYLTMDGARHVLEPTAETATEAVEQEAAHTELRLRAADVLQSRRLADAETLLAELHALSEQPAWAAFVIGELAQIVAPPAIPPTPLLPPTLGHIPSSIPNFVPALFHTVSGVQQAAALGLGRGLMCTASASSDDPLNTAFIQRSTGDPTMSPPFGSMSAALPPPPLLGPALSQCFSSPTQRAVSETLRQRSGASRIVSAPVTE